VSGSSQGWSRRQVDPGLRRAREGSERGERGIDAGDGQLSKKVVVLASIWACCRIPARASTNIATEIKV
jgi:hypothetical protein